MNNNKNTNKLAVIVLALIIIILVAVVSFDVYDHYFKNGSSSTNQSSSTSTSGSNGDLQINTSDTNSSVTVNDTDLSESVSKIYDATVIVEIYQGNELQGWGSGFVYSTDDKYAYIVTNYHVTESAQSVKIVYSDESETDGTVLGGDKYTDVSVVRVDKNTIKAVATIGSSTNTKVGDTVFTVGTPISLTYSFTVTRGILSGKNRLVQTSDSNNSNSIFGNSSSEYWYINLLQIDASINSGNSGGPLCNAAGEVIGITNMKQSYSFGSSATVENIGFAIPIEDVANIAKQVIQNGKVERPYLGLQLTTVEGAQTNGVSIDSSIKEGAVVVSVESGSPADKAGFKKGDVITKFGDYDISDYIYLKYYLNRYYVGDTVTVTYIRNGKTETTNITLSEKKE